MKNLSLLLALLLLANGCARKTGQGDAAANLEEAQKKIQKLETERVPRIDYDVAKASLHLAEERIGGLEKELKEAKDQLAAKNASAATAPLPAAARPAAVQGVAVAKGTHEESNGTLVYSPDAQLNVGEHLQITSPTGLLVTDPEQKVVGGDLNIQAREVTLETADGLLTTEPDGSVKFTGNSLTMKFPQEPTPAKDQKPSPEGEPAGDAPHPSQALPSSETASTQTR